MDIALIVKFLAPCLPFLLSVGNDLLKEEYSQDPDLRRLADLGLGNLQQLLTDPQVGVSKNAYLPTKHPAFNY